MYTHWSDVLGNELNATEVVKTFNRQHKSGETFAAWLERQSRELWGSDHQDEDWQAMADKITADAHA